MGWTGEGGSSSKTFSETKLRVEGKKTTPQVVITRNWNRGGSRLKERESVKGVLKKNA